MWRPSAADALHRQKSIHSGSGKLFRKIELTAREGSRHRRTLHFHECGPKTGTADGSPPLPTEGAVPIARRAEEHRAHSAHAFGCARSAVTQACLCLRGAAAIDANERGWCLARVSARAGVRPSMFCSWPHGRDGDERLRLQMASCWAYFVGGRGLRLLGCVVWVTVQLAATYFVMRRLVRRENASSDLDLAGACTAYAG